MMKATKLGLNNEYSSDKEKDIVIYNEMVDAVVLHKQAIQFSIIRIFIIYNVC